MITLKNIKKVFKTEEVETWALQNVNLEVKKGEFVAIMGRSGYCDGSSRYCTDEQFVIRCCSCDFS